MRFRPELGLEHRPALREQLLERAVRRGVQGGDVEPIVHHVNVKLQTCEWQHEPPSELDIRQRAFTFLEWRIIDTFRANAGQPEQLPDGSARLAVPGEETVGQLDRAIAEEDEAALCEQRKAYDRLVARVTDPSRRWYCGQTGGSLHKYDVCLLDARSRWPKASGRKLGRILKRFFQRFFADLPGSGAIPYWLRDDTLACQRIAFLQTKMTKLRRGDDRSA